MKKHIGDDMNDKAVRLKLRIEDPGMQGLEGLEHLIKELEFDK